MEKQAYRVRVSGCDDETEVVVQLTAAEADTVGRIASEVTATSSFSCMPTMVIEPATRIVIHHSRKEASVWAESPDRPEWSGGTEDEDGMKALAEEACKVWGWPAPVFETVSDDE